MLLRILVADESQPAAAARPRPTADTNFAEVLNAAKNGLHGKEGGGRRAQSVSGLGNERINMIILCKSELIWKISLDNSYLCYRPAQGVPVLLHLHHVHQGPLGRREDPRGVRPRVQGSPGRGICEWSHILVETLATMGLFTFFRRDVSSTER